MLMSAGPKTELWGISFIKERVKERNIACCMMSEMLLFGFFFSINFHFSLLLSHAKMNTTLLFMAVEKVGEQRDKAKPLEY